MSEFNLRHLVREVLQNTTMTDPTGIAREVGRRIGDDDCRTALEQALRGFVREEITRLRQHPFLPEPSVSPVSNVTPLASGGVPEPQQKAPVRPIRSAKVTGIRDLGAKLRELTHVGDSEWRRLGDCSFEDLMFAASERREHAARNTARAVWFEELAVAVREAGVSRVRDLPAVVLQSRLKEVAA